MEIASKKLYMREHSNVVRIWSSSSRQSMVENPAFHIDRRSRVMIVCICRIRQRLLKQAWQTFTERTGVKHDYNQDLRTILSRQLPADELRTELEIEVLYKWVMQAKDIDPTGIASTIFHCKKKGAIYNALQQLRLEYYGPGEVVIYQGDYPRMEDGHFTILSGECEVLQFTGDSVRLTKLLACARKRRWEEAKELLEAAQVVAHIPTFSGFGELSTLTGVKRAATILTSKISDISEIVVLPKHPLLDLLKYRNKETTQSSEQSEAIDFLRQSGLANRISPKDLVLAASSMSKRTLHEGDILYYKGEEVKCIYMVVSGEFLLDTNDFILEGVIPMPFVNSTSDSCHNLSAGSILGDEGVIGETRVFESTAAVVSSVAVVFQAEGFAMNFISEKMGCLRYSALFYRDRLCWEAEHQVAEQINPYTFFDSLRKSIAYTKPFRGTKKLKEEEVETPIVALVKQRKAARIQKLNEPTTAGKSSYLSGRKSPSGRRSPTHRADRPITPKTFAMNELRKTLDTSLFPRVLRGMALHRALEINKTVKRFLQNCIKNHAKENILHEELKRRTLEEKMLQNEGIRGHDATIDELQNDDDTEKRQTKSAFEKSLRDYYDRSAEVTRKLAEAAELNRTQAVSTGAAVRFFSLLSEDDNDSIGSQSSMTVSENGRLTATASVDNSNNLMTDEHGNAVDSASKLGSTKRSKHNSNHHNIYITPTSSHASSAHSLVVKDEKNPQLYQSKIKEYFEWLDGLKRQQFRALLNQSQQTIDINSDYDIEAKLGINILIDGGKGLSDEQGVDWNEISEVFQTYSLTPADLQLPWIFARVASNSNPPSPVHGILKHNSSQHLGSPKHQLGSPIMSPMALGGGGRSASAKLKISPTAQTDGRPQSPKSNTVLAKPVSPKNKITFNDVPQVKEIPKNNPNDKRGRSRNNNSKVDKNKNNSKRGGVQNPPSKVSASSPSPSPSPAPSERRKSQLGNGRRGGIVPLNARPLSPEDEHYEELKARAFVQREVGGTGYIPSDWRGDYIAKKANDLNMMPLEFHRFKVPENRRTLPLHVRVHDFDEKLHEKFLSSSHTGHHTNNAEPKKESPRTKEGKPPLSLQVSFADRERRSNDGKSKPPNIGQIPTSPSNNTILTGLSKESKDEKQLAELKAQLMEYIDSPEFFLQHLLTADVSSKNRKVDSGFGWNTRYMTSQENQKKQPPPILKAVRTHLEENLDAYSKEHLLNVFEDLKNQNYEQAMKAILGKKDYANKSNTLTSSATATALGGSGGRIGLLKREDSDRSSYSPTPSLSRSVSYRDKVEGAGEGAIATTNQTYPFLTPEHRRPSWKEDEEAELSRKLSIILETNETASNSITGAKSQELLENSSSAVSGNIPRPAQLLLSRENSLQDLLSLPSGESSVTGEEGAVPKKSALKSSVGTIGRKSSPAPLSRANSNSNVNSPKKPGKSALSRSNSKSNLPTPTHHSPTQQVLSADSSNSVSPGGIAMATTLSNPISATASNNVTFSTVKLSDIKAPSKALQMFEDFMQQQQMPSKAASEGRKKANRTSRFRLPAMIAQEERTNNNIHELVNIREVQKDRLKMELTLFQALNPHYTQKDKEIFIESFKNLNPTLSTSMQQINMILSDIEHEIEENSENVQRQLFIKKMQERRTNTSSFDGSAMHSRQFSAESLLSANTPYSPQLSNPRGMSGISRFSFLSSPDGNASSPKPFATSPSPSATSAANYTQWDEQMQLERWQEYTLQNILQNKNGERKTLPLVKLPKLMTEMSGGKKYRSSASTKAVLITLPAKVEEESIEGPTSYLELYKSSFKVRTSSKAKAKVVEELKLKLPHH